jgi:hypothetical protein
LSDYATYQELAESISKDENDLEEAEAEEPISDENSKIKGNLRTRQVVQKTADRYTRKSDIRPPNSRSGGKSIDVVYRFHGAGPYAYGDESPKQEANGFVSGFDSCKSPARRVYPKTGLVWLRDLSGAEFFKREEILSSSYPRTSSTCVYK